MPTVTIFAGLPASGKTTFARSIERESGAIRFTLDEWMKDLCEHSIFDKEYGLLANRLKDKIWELSQQLLKLNHNIVLDWSLWSRAARKEWTSRIKVAGYNYKLFVFDSPLEVVESRLVARNSNLPPGVHSIDIEEVRRFARIFESYDQNEGLDVEFVR